MSNLRRLHQVIWVEETINYYTEKNQSPDRVLDIFVRANDGGTKLDKPDLLMSMITSKWSAGAAREEMFSFVEYIKSGLSVPNKFTRDVLLKACLTLLDFDVQYNVANFTSEVSAADSTLHRWALSKNKKGTLGNWTVNWNGASAAFHMVSEARERHEPAEPPR